MGIVIQNDGNGLRLLRVKENVAGVKTQRGEPQSRIVCRLVFAYSLSLIGDFRVQWNADGALS